MIKRLPRRAVTLLLVALACVAVAACAVYSIHASADIGAGISAHEVGAKARLAGGTAGSSGPAGAAGSGTAGPAATSGQLIVPDLFILARRPLTAGERAAITRQAGPRGHVLFTDAGMVRIGGGTTLALGVDPGTFRVYTPANTAAVAPLWRSVEAGDLAVAHEFASAQHLRLGGTVVVGASVPSAGTGRGLRVGAYATTGLPGVGAVVARSLSAPVGLVPGAGALVDYPPGTDGSSAARVALQRAVPGALLVPLTRPPSPNATPGRPAPDPAPGADPWVLPAQGPLASPFGPRPGEFHPGIDIAAPLGAPIVAAADGVVTSAGPASGFGNAVVIAHGRGVETVYGHMRYWFVRSGQRVRAGQLIALVGSEGHSTGPHLHFEVHRAGKLSDPAAWLAARGITVPTR